MKKEKPQTKVIDLKIADATDEELKAILEVRKKYSIGFLILTILVVFLLILGSNWRRG